MTDQNAQAPQLDPAALSKIAARRMAKAESATNIARAKVGELSIKILDLETEIASLQEDRADLVQRVNETNKELEVRTNQLHKQIATTNTIQDKLAAMRWMAEQLLAQIPGAPVQITEEHMKLIFGMHQAVLEGEKLERNKARFWEEPKPEPAPEPEIDEDAPEAVAVTEEQEQQAQVDAENAPAQPDRPDNSADAPSKTASVTVKPGMGKTLADGLEASKPSRRERRRQRAEHSQQDQQVRDESQVNSDSNEKVAFQVEAD